MFEIINNKNEDKHDTNLIIKISTRKENLLHEIYVLSKLRENWRNVYPNTNYSSGPLPQMTAYGCFLMNDTLLYQSGTDESGENKNFKHDYLMMKRYQKTLKELETTPKITISVLS